MIVLIAVLIFVLAAGTKRVVEDKRENKTVIIFRK